MRVPMTLTVGKKGSIRLNVKKGLIMTVECLEWILDLITSEKAPGPYKAQTSAF